MINVAYSHKSNKRQVLGNIFGDNKVAIILNDFWSPARYNLISGRTIGPKRQKIAHMIEETSMSFKDPKSEKGHLPTVPTLR